MRGPIYKMAFACFNCCKSFKRAVNAPHDCPNSLICPHCGHKAINLGRHFKPPKSRDKKQWQKVEFLVNHGFHFQKVRLKRASIYLPEVIVPYPNTLEQAKEFVVTYKDYGWLVKE